MKFLPLTFAAVASALFSHAALTQTVDRGVVGSCDLSTYANSPDNDVSFGEIPNPSKKAKRHKTSQKSPSTMDEKDVVDISAKEPTNIDRDKNATVDRANTVEQQSDDSADKLEDYGIDKVDSTTTSGTSTPRPYGSTADITTIDKSNNASSDAAGTQTLRKSATISTDVPPRDQSPMQPSAPEQSSYRTRDRHEDYATDLNRDRDSISATRYGDVMEEYDDDYYDYHDDEDFSSCCLAYNYTTEGAYYSGVRPNNPGVDQPYNPAIDRPTRTLRDREYDSVIGPYNSARGSLYRTEQIPCANERGITCSGNAICQGR